jgi:hypothetical protein
MMTEKWLNRNASKINVNEGQVVPTGSPEKLEMER